ncbi:outer membrane lipoprotein chaperone LolA [Marinicella gelatinilytica]|uniref:outer membrane lipoprotein chaperone LolA n=1 Tax=Marinicella gelatinilytica TaxID=2996017 RepID=UPI002260D724|nr:outer membrane lipoprotein chaperone LolA [Marinicella gelatinilytica]MCX7544662.1 outer membrane lipoprotein chaperone LolA [Marinicella gelatinilytica]
MKKALILLVCVFAAGLTLAQSDNDNAIDNKAQDILSELRQDLSALQAEFKQYELSQDGHADDKNSGTVWMQAPDFFKWHYKEPFEQLIVADGEQVWVYDEDLQQVTVKPQNNNLNPIYVIINEELSTRYYHIAYEGEQQDLSWVKLTPKETSDEVKSVMLGIKNKQLHRIHVNNQLDQTLVFEFSDLKRNPTLSKDTFQFTPPEGVDVVEAIE